MLPIIKTISIALAAVILAATIANAKIEDDISKDLLQQGYAVGNQFALALKQSVKKDVSVYTQKYQFKKKEEVVTFVERSLRRHAWNIYHQFLRAMRAMLNTSYSGNPNAVRPTRADEKKLVKTVAETIYDQTKLALINEVVRAYNVK